MNRTNVLEGFKGVQPVFQNPEGGQKEAGLLAFGKTVFPIDAQTYYSSVNEFLSSKKLKEGKTLGKGEYGSVCAIEDEQCRPLCVMKLANDANAGISTSEFNAKSVCDDSVAGVYLGIVKNKRTGCFELVSSREELDKKNKYCSLQAVFSEYAPGAELFDYLDNLINMEHSDKIKEINHLAMNITRGVVALHEAGLLYLDLKPENIMYDPGSGTVKIVDFGTTCSIDDVANIVKRNGNKIPGTMDYMAPEAWQNKFSFGSDLWGLAALLMEIAINKTPDVVFAESEDGEKAGLDVKTQGPLDYVTKVKGFAGWSDEQKVEELLGYLDDDEKEDYRKLFEVIAALTKEEPEKRMSALDAANRIEGRDASTKTVVTASGLPESVGAVVTIPRKSSASSDGGYDSMEGSRDECSEDEAVSQYSEHFSSFEEAQSKEL